MVGARSPHQLSGINRFLARQFRRRSIYAMQGQIWLQFRGLANSCLTTWTWERLIGTCSGAINQLRRLESVIMMSRLLREIRPDWPP